MKRKFLRQKTGGRSPAPVVNKRLSFSLGKNNRDTNRNTNRNKDSDRNRDEDISSDEEMDDDRNDDEEDSKDNDDSDEEEDPEAKRKRLAKQYLSAFQSLDQDSDENDSNDDGGVGPSLSVSEHLKMNRLAKEGKYFQELSTKVAAMDIDSLTKHSNTFQSTVTAVAATTDSTKIYCTGKDNSICCIDTETNTKTIVKNRWLGAEDDAAHKRDGEQLCVAVTTDGRYVAAGGKDNKIRIYDSRTNNSEVKVFTGHKDAVTCLTFQKDTYALFSGSLDRCIKYWDLNEMGYLETLFGHQDYVYSLDCWNKQRPVSSSSDRTVRAWKIADGSHLVFRGHKGSIDNVQVLEESTFATGGQDGMISIWKDTQKHATASVTAAHGYDSNLVNARWITSLSTIKMSDLLFSGSYDGYLRGWSASIEKRKIQSIINIPVEGIINSISTTNQIVVAGTGKEHKYGRWWSIKGNKNKVVTFRFPELLGEMAKATELLQEEEESIEQSDYSDEVSDED